MKSIQSCSNDLLLVILSFLCFICNFTLAQDASYPIQVQTSIIAVLMIIAGFVLCFWGQRLFPLMLFIAGFMVFGFIAYVSCIEISPPVPTLQSPPNLVIGVVVGLIGGYLFRRFWTLGVLAIGALAGFALAMFILSLGNGFLISSSIGRTIFVILCVVVGVVLMWFFEKHTLIIGSAFFGAYLLVSGIDYFIRTGFAQHIYGFLRGGSYATSGKVYAMIATWVVLAIIGAAIQYRTYKPWERHHTHHRRRI
ncbi:hypothetical protein K7432_011443 [Basidiobolus ranarum]|uniref:Transmembrane protein 198 n=1 Tax=Basidiobolus ranarum TaxID=34480 RepID=A0ABR2WM84_9FUNG